MSLHVLTANAGLPAGAVLLSPNGSVSVATRAAPRSLTPRFLHLVQVFCALPSKENTLASRLLRSWYRMAPNVPLSPLLVALGEDAAGLLCWAWKRGGGSLVGLSPACKALLQAIPRYEAEVATKKKNNPIYYWWQRLCARVATQPLDVPLVWWFPGLVLTGKQHGGGPRLRPLEQRGVEMFQRQLDSVYAKRVVAKEGWPCALEPPGLAATQFRLVGHLRDWVAHLPAGSTLPGLEKTCQQYQLTQWYLEHIRMLRRWEPSAVAWVRKWLQSRSRTCLGALRE